MEHCSAKQVVSHLKDPLLPTGNISAVSFSIQTVDESTVSVNITDPVTSIHQQQKQLSIRDVLKEDLEYKITYYKSGSTGKVTRSSLLAFSFLNSVLRFWIFKCYLQPTSHPKNPLV